MFARLRQIVGKRATVEVLFVVLLAVVTAVLTVHFGIVDRFAILEGNPNGGDLADLGPALLVLSAGMGLITARRLTDSVRERDRLDVAQKALEKSEERYRTLIDVSPDPVVVVRGAEIIFVNPSAVALFGAANAADLTGRSVLDLLPADVRESAPAWLGSALEAEGAAPVLVHPLQRLDGTLIETETVVVRATYEGETALLALVRDVSARRRADEAATRYQALAENAEEIVLFADTGGRIMDCNRAALMAYGYTLAELRRMTVWDLRVPGSTNSTGVDLTKSPGDVARFDTVHETKGGVPIELSITAQRVSVAGDEFIVSVCHDVTNARKAERELRDSEERYRTLVEVSPTPVAVYGQDRIIVYANQAALDLVRAHSPSDLIGRETDLFVHPDSREDARIGRLSLERDGNSSGFRDITLLRCDGTTIEAQMAISRCCFNGAPAFQAVFQDVSHLKSVAETLRRTTETTISAMARLAETRDPYTSGHQERVAEIAYRIARCMRLMPAVCESIRVAGIVHDIGKLNVPAEILSKPGRLSDTEFSLIKTHAERGYELLAPIDFPWPIAEIVREHHERLDGSGYPRGLKDGEIMIEARVIAIADTLEAISAHRPYRPALGPEVALQAIRDGRGTLYDEAGVDAALELAARGALFAPLGESAGVPATA